MSTTKEIDPRQQTRERLIKDLQDGKFLLYSQAIVRIAPSPVDLPSYRQVLVRFQEEEEGLMPPGTFIPILEEYGLMPILDRWVTQQVVNWIVGEAARSGSRPPPRCSVTLSIDTLRRDPGFVEYAVAKLERSKIRPGLLCFEIPEFDAVVHAEALAGVIEPLRAGGCSFVLTGFSGEERAFQVAGVLGVTYVKTDGSLTHAIRTDSAAKAKLQAVHGRCHKAGMQLICGQVEDSGTLDVLKALPVDFAQGFGLARPQPLSGA